MANHKWTNQKTRVKMQNMHTDSVDFDIYPQEANFDFEKPHPFSKTAYTNRKNSLIVPTAIPPDGPKLTKLLRNMKKSEDLLRTVTDFETDFREVKSGIELEPFEIQIDKATIVTPKAKKKSTVVYEALHSPRTGVWVKKRKQPKSSGINIPIRNRP